MRLLNSEGSSSIMKDITQNFIFNLNRFTFFVKKIMKELLHKYYFMAKKIHYSFGI